MTHTETIWIIVTLSFVSTFGVFASIRYIKLNTRPPINTLNRRGDMELQEVIDPIQHINVRDIDYIEPSNPGHAYYPIDLSNPQYINYSPYYENARVHSYWSGTPPSYFTGTAPSYHTTDRFYIHSYFEDIINIDHIYLCFVLIIFLIMMNYPRIKYLVKRFLQLTNIMNIKNLLIILIINYYLLRNSLYGMTILIPFSFFEIDFRESFEWEFNSYRVKPKISYLKLQTLTNDIDFLLLSLIDDVNYSMSFSFISSYNEWKEDKEKIKPLFINDPIIVNKESDSLLITQFIMQNLNKKGYFITNRLFNDDLINQIDPVILTVTVAIKVEI